MNKKNNSNKNASKRPATKKTTYKAPAKNTAIVDAATKGLVTGLFNGLERAFFDKDFKFNKAGAKTISAVTKNTKSAPAKKTAELTPHQKAWKTRRANARKLAKSRSY